MKSKNKKKPTVNNRLLNQLCDKAEDLTVKQRRSIPVKEVDEMIDRAVARVKSERTIYDDRNSLIEAINEVERDIEHHEVCLHNLEKNLISLKLQLNKTNTAIKRELDLDSLR